MPRRGKAEPDAQPLQPAETTAARVAASPRSVLRILGLLEALAGAKAGGGLAQLSLQLASPKSSLRMLLRPRAQAGYLSHAEGRYRFGPRMYRLAADILATREFPKLLRPLLEELAHKSQETVYLAVLDRTAKVATYVEMAASPQAVRYAEPVGFTRQLYASAGGQLLLAYEPADWREQYLKTVTFTAVGPRPPVGKAELRKTLEQIGRDGVAVSIEQAAAGGSAIAVPIYGAQRRVDAALVIAGPTERVIPRTEELKRMLKAAAAEASGVDATLPATDG